jgi:hypothetical protein
VSPSRNSKITLRKLGLPLSSSLPMTLRPISNLRPRRPFQRVTAPARRTCAPLRQCNLNARAFKTGMTLSELEHRHWRSVVRVLKYNGDLLADSNITSIAGDDVS